MRPIQLTDVVPQGAAFKLAATNKTYRLRPVSLDDELWMHRTFGDHIEKVFSEVRMKEISRIVFHQMIEEDKADFAAREVKFMNEEGETISGRVGGYNLLACMIQGYTEKMDIFNALLETVGVSRKMVGELSKELEAEQKKSLKEASLEDIGDGSLTIGEPSSISFPISTDGPPSTSGAER